MLTREQALVQCREGKPGEGQGGACEACFPHTLLQRDGKHRKQAVPAFCLLVLIFLTSSENSNKCHDNVSLITLWAKGL